MDFLNRVAVVTGGTGAVGRVRVRGLAGGLRAGGRPRHAHRAGAARCQPMGWEPGAPELRVLTGHHAACKTMTYTPVEHSTNTSAYAASKAAVIPIYGQR